MWALSRLWRVRSHMTTTCCYRSRKWKSSRSLHSPRAALMRVFFSWKVTLLPCYLPLAPGLASSFAFSFPGIPEWAGTHCVASRLCCTTSWRLSAAWGWWWHDLGWDEEGEDNGARPGEGEWRWPARSTWGCCCESLLYSDVNEDDQQNRHEVKLIKMKNRTYMRWMKMSSKI